MYQVAFAHTDALELFTKKALQWASLFDEFCYLNGNEISDQYSKLSAVLAVGTSSRFAADEQHGTSIFSQLQSFLDERKDDWKFGFFNYDLKNQIEELDTSESPFISFPPAHFFVPRHLVFIDKARLCIAIQSDSTDDILKKIHEQHVQDMPFAFQGKIHPKMDKEKYLETFKKLQAHILHGDIYEVNLCQEFIAEQASLDPLWAYWALNEISPTPFSSFFKYQQQYMLCASPERFLAKRGNQLISQPIKGTAKRELADDADGLARKTLLQDPKERSENIMIVDLVRNDLTKSAKPGTVQVRELAGLYTFKQVHQLISTVTCELGDGMNEASIIANTFPPGSMTGAPKVSAMRLIDRYEESARGIYAGSIGYFAPDGDFDFNVVIRSLLYDARQARISFHVGGAITALADGEKEYEECFVKAKGILELLKDLPVDTPKR